MVATMTRHTSKGGAGHKQRHKQRCGPRGFLACAAYASLLLLVLVLVHVEETDASSAPMSHVLLKPMNQVCNQLKQHAYTQRHTYMQQRQHRDAVAAFGEQTIDDEDDDDDEGADARERYERVMEERKEKTCVVYKPLVVNTPVYEEDKEVYYYGSPIHINVPFQVEEIHLNATIKTSGLPGAQISLRAQALDRFKDVPVKDELVTLKTASLGDNLMTLLANDQQHNSEWVNIGWTSRTYHSIPFDHGLKNLTNLAGIRMTPLQILRQQLARKNTTITSHKSLKQYLNTRRSFHAGNGGALGTWTLEVESAYPMDVKDWSMEMCFDAVKNYKTLCSDQLGKLFASKHLISDE